MSQHPEKESLKERLANFGHFLDYKIACWDGHCPKSQEIQNHEVKSLADRLKGSSYKETLTNILDWQGRNITFWIERHPIVTMLTYFGIGSLTIGSFALLGLIVFIALSYHSIILILSYSTWFIATWIAITLTGTILILVLMTQIIRSNRKIPILEGLKNAFSRSISIDFFLEKKLGVCRDSAKLTASLVLNIYPDAEIYFASAPSHVATGIMIENKLYMLDQRLPILTLNNWKKYRHMKGKLAKLGNKSIELVDSKPFLSQAVDDVSLDTQKLAITLTKLLNINQRTSNENDSIAKIKWKKGITQYQDEEMVNYSLSRLLQTKISMEMIELSQITRINVVSEKEDLIFLIHLRL